MRLKYSDNLPVAIRRDEIGAQLLANQVIIIAGDTGSGKTTQIPKICLETLNNEDLVIGCTQPRRIAATSVASRVAEELGDMGHLVGYKIRFHDHTDKRTRIKFMTDGVLLAETRSDPLLRKYDVIILDEAHERSLNIDFLLGYLKRILPRRPDLKLIITSATIDTEAFSHHFNQAPVISIGGKTYPVTVKYRPVDELKEGGEGASYVEHCADAILDIHTNDLPGDILAFLPTEKDIRACCEIVQNNTEKAIVLPMFGRLQAGDQKRIFQQFNKPKIVVATNVAETSVTVPGIRYVVDSGLARMSYYNARAKTTSLPVQRISRASSDQRKGRCGRVGPGTCVRLYSEEDYNSRDEFTLPEIRRANLAEVILQMISLKLGRPDTFPFIDPPNKNAVRDGYKLLGELGAVTKTDSLTEIGRFMASLPIDPCISRILLEASDENCLTEVKVIASALAIQDPRIRPAEREKEADQAHKKFSHPHSDFMVLLNIWNGIFGGDAGDWSWSKLKKFCKANYLSFQRMREWFDLHEQLDRLLKRSSGFNDNIEEASYQQIHRALTSGFLRNIAQKKQGKIYQGAANRELMIFPGSHQFLRGGQWLVAASFLETNRLYALTVATIEPEWLEHLGSHLVKYSWSNPRWNKKSGQVVADEKVSLFGLTVVQSRTVNFPKRSEKNREDARSIFIQAALLEGDISGNYPFITRNRSLVEQWKNEEDKLRTSTLLVDEATLAEFYDQRLPDFVCDRQSLNRFLKKRGFKKLLMTEEHILRKKPAEDHSVNFPSTLEVNGIALSLSYNFSPGSDDDGITVNIPVSIAPTLSPLFFEWVVPGLLQEKITLLLKGLPKSVRRHLVPVNVAVERTLDDMVLYRGSLFQSLEASIHKLYRVAIGRSEWPETLPPHLNARFVLLDTEGVELCSGRNLTNLVKSMETFEVDQETAGTELSSDNEKLIARWEGFTTDEWAFAELPPTITLTNSKGQMVGLLFSTLVSKVNQGCVTVEFVTKKVEADINNRNGVEHLYRLQFKNEYKLLLKYCGSLTSGPSAKQLFSGKKDANPRDMLMGFVMRNLFPGIGSTIPEKEQFISEVERVKKAGFYREGKEIADQIARLIRSRGECVAQLRHYTKLDKRKFVFTDKRVQRFMNSIDDSVSTDFLVNGTTAELDLCGRLLRSLNLRIERCYANPQKDEMKEASLAPHLANYHAVSKKYDDLSEEGQDCLRQYKVMIDEFSISLFSPEIKTRSGVSEKKLKNFWLEVQTKC